jgi:hypothetical protein
LIVAWAQSLVPETCRGATVFASLVEDSVRRAKSFEGHDPSIREIVVSYGCNTLVCVLAVLVCFRLLPRLEFTLNQSLAGALGLLFGTTFLHYTQNMVENNLITLLDLTDEVHL